MKMYRVPPAQDWWPAVGAPLERIRRDFPIPPRRTAALEDRAKSKTSLLTHWGVVEDGSGAAPHCVPALCLGYRLRDQSFQNLGVQISETLEVQACLAHLVLSELGKKRLLLLAL